MVATGQKSTLGAVARHPGADVGYLCRFVGFVHDWWPPGVAARLPCSRVPVPRALGASRAPQRLHAASSRTGRGSPGLWGGSRVMATMATMATPKLNLEKKKNGRGGGGDNPPTDTQHEILFLGVGPRGVAMVAMVATSLKVTLGAVARHPGADVGYQGVLTGGTVAARVEAGQGHADSTPTRGAPIPSLGLGGATTRSVSGHRWPPWPPWPPLGRDSQKKTAAMWGGRAARRRDPCPVIDGHHGHHGHPSVKTLKKKSRS